MTGKVWFVGAGPGDPELLTVKGRRLLEEAGAILYAGSLVDRAATLFAPPGCEIRDSKDMTLEEMTAWLLDQAKAYEQQKGKRILHYLDLHYYPQGGNPPAVTRSLWDPSYTDPSFINAQIRLLPRMRDWVSQHYPGTKTLVSEYDFYSQKRAAS